MDNCWLLHRNWLNMSPSFIDIVCVIALLNPNTHTDWGLSNILLTQLWHRQVLVLCMFQVMFVRQLLFEWGTSLNKINL